MCDGHINRRSIQQNNLEVFNIANVTSNGEIVLNDEKLLELVQIYPFLYDSSVKPFLDADYDEWAWNKIAISFNKWYDGYPIATPFSPAELRQRWAALRPIVVGLSKVSGSIPVSIRNHVHKISPYLERTTEVVTEEPLSNAQRIIFDNIEMVEKLPMEQRKQLESEIMQLILSREQDEIEPLLIHKSDPIRQKVDQECNEFFQAIGIDDLSFTYDDDDVSSEDIEEIMVLPSTTSKMHHDSNGITNNALKTVPPLKIKLRNVEPHIDNLEDWSTSSNTTLPNNPLLMPLNRPRWVDLDKAPHYIRKCRVRLKRFTLPEDELPLARIKDKL